MDKIRAVIIDDEKSLRLLLRQNLETEFSQTIQIVGEADDVEPGVALILEQKPAVVFLDIKMKKGTGFDLLNRIEEKNFEVVFVTAYDEYAVEAFQFSAFGYLLKPFKLSQLQTIIDKLLVQLKESATDKGKQLKVLIENYSGEQVQKLVIKNMSGFQVLELKQLVRLESEINYTHFYMSDGKKFTSSRTIKVYEELLAKHGFYRVHQQYVVNLGHVISYVKGEGGTAILSDSSEIPVAKKRKSGFLKRFL
jgi:two-component system LytT family response regulator